MGTARDRAVAVARRLQGLRRLVPRPVPPAPAPVALPADVADAEGLRRRLAETDIFGAAAEEAHGYLFDAFERFRITMALLPALGSGARVLELGANPYFLTRLLRDRGYDMTLANWFGPSSGFGSRGSQTVTESGVPYTYEFDHFNIEADPFPYDDDAFDAVLFCEILEHLPFDPIHTLAEIHRVLRPGGALVLTTPNAIRLDNLIRMAEGRNVYETLSGYGTYGRHNREYTVDELRLLLDGCGFAVQSVFAADIGHPPPPASFGPEVSGVDRGENLFAVARAEGPPRWQYPPWLYSSVHALKKAVRSDVVCGVNCDLQTGGLYDVERSVLVSGGHVRWTGRAPRASLLLRCAGGPARLRLTGVAPPLGSVAAGSLTLHAELDGQVVSWALACDGRAFAVDAEVKAAEGDQEVALWTDRTWSPAAGGT
ncbi:MAG TPA: class I SAM-dependent methyltransferase, partial [Acidimicrobiales bacterium]|nr:class I SAM-dependent methyltransferase [Acidimicrobiales bacterium]